MQLYLAAEWQAEAAPSDGALDRLVTEFDVDDGQPCIRTDIRPNGVSITWDAWVSFHSSNDDVFDLALADARRYVPERLVRAGIPGRLLELEAGTGEATVTWRADSSE